VRYLHRGRSRTRLIISTSTPNSASATYQTGQDTVVRAAFINNGVLPNTQDTNFRAISNNWPVFGFAHNLGTVSAASAPVLFSVGHVRDPALQYETKSGLQNRSSYFWSKYSSVLTLISDFLTDYPNALSRANTLDAQVDAGKISTNYAALAALSLRQAMGATEITISKSSSGAWNTSDVLMFLKEISSDGVSSPHSMLTLAVADALVSERQHGGRDLPRLAGIHLPQPELGQVPAPSAVRVPRLILVWARKPKQTLTVFLSDRSLPERVGRSRHGRLVPCGERTQRRQ
jgi:hypothetical protein